MKRIDYLKAVAMIIPLTYAVPGVAKAADWYWDQYGTDNYTGQITIKDSSGADRTLDRYDSSVAAPLWGASAVQSPIVVAAAANTAEMDISMYRTGLVTDKYVCPAGKNWNVSLSITNVCASGVAHDISGVRLSYEDVDATTWKPLMHVHVTGYGWLEVSNSDCGVVEAKQFCTEP
tara:strand:+ start:1406 stop:1933 length:528 start_codon:yes stop_codon:yes gene_type:complete